MNQRDDEKANIITHLSTKHNGNEETSKKTQIETVGVIVNFFF